jgi:transcriptional regulator with XRE-family HTH domain
MIEKNVYLKLLGENIIRHRKEKKWTQSDLARSTEKDRQSIERLENGKINPSIYYLKQVSEGLEVKLSNLLDFEE